MLMRCECSFSIRHPWTKSALSSEKHPFDTDKCLFVITRDHMRSILGRFLSGELSSEQVKRRATHLDLRTHLLQADRQRFNLLLFVCGSRMKVPSRGSGSRYYGLIVKVFAFDVPPPGGAFTTVTEAVAAVAMSAAEMEAVSFMLLTNVVVRGDPFQFTTEPETKCEPFTVSVKAGPPAVALLGEIELIAGTGLLMVNVIALDVPPPGGAFTTVTEAVPAVLMSDEGTVAVT